MHKLFVPQDYFVVTPSPRTRLYEDAILIFTVGDASELEKAVNLELSLVS